MSKATEALKGLREGKDYKKSKWGEFDNYECGYCKRAELNPVRLATHVRETHRKELSKAAAAG